MILLTLGVETLARLMEPEARDREAAWLLAGPAEDAVEAEEPPPAADA
ncbi:hypothetical protein [Caulobacter sp. 17J80-11]|nr:hypothetical protein [Caulobacter sp. 17J80-11]MBC6982613.1 hypothetical protein [Caulobacter sp. 17J80-11]